MQVTHPPLHASFFSSGTCSPSPVASTAGLLFPRGATPILSVIHHQRGSIDWPRIVRCSRASLIMAASSLGSGCSGMVHSRIAHAAVLPSGADVSCRRQDTVCLAQGECPYDAIKSRERRV